MCIGCGVSEAEREEFRAAAEAWDQETNDSWSGVELPFSGGLPPDGSMWVSTGIAPSTTEPQCLLIRDAIASLARVFFDRDDPRTVVTAWHRSITPMLLDTAANFGGGSEPLVWVICRRHDERDELLRMGDWRRARLLDVSRDEARTSVGGTLGALIFVNGDAASEEDDAQLPGHILRFALASTGGQAADLARSALRRELYAGGDTELVDELADEHTSYLVVMTKILAAIGSNQAPLQMTMSP